VRRLRDRSRQRELAAARAKAEADRQRAETYARDRRLRTRYREMQAALLQLESAPDFQRAAWFAAHAQGIPVEFRQRQFQRFRPKLLQYLVTRLRGGNVEQLRLSLTELVTQLGVAPFEADYLWREADRQTQAPPEAAPDFAAEMSGREQEHQQRLAVLRSLTAIDQELREQLVEAEEQRFREAMLALNEETLTPPAEA
jgi:hypothetical protein